MKKRGTMATGTIVKATVAIVLIITMIWIMPAQIKDPLKKIIGLGDLEELESELAITEKEFKETELKTVSNSMDALACAINSIATGDYPHQSCREPHEIQTQNFIKRRVSEDNYVKIIGDSLLSCFKDFEPLGKEYANQPCYSVDPEEEEFTIKKGDIQKYLKEIKDDSQAKDLTGKGVFELGGTLGIFNTKSYDILLSENKIKEGSVICGDKDDHVLLTDDKSNCGLRKEIICEGENTRKYGTACLVCRGENDKKCCRHKQSGQVTGESSGVSYEWKTREECSRIPLGQVVDDRQCGAKNAIPTDIESCEIKGFELPQDLSKYSGDDWIAGLGDPQYIIYYESFPQGMEKYWSVDAGSFAPYIIIAGGVLNAISPPMLIKGAVQKGAGERIATEAGERLAKEGLEDTVESFMKIAAKDNLEGVAKKYSFKQAVLEDNALRAVLPEGQIDDMIAELSSFYIKKGGKAVPSEVVGADITLTWKFEEIIWKLYGSGDAAVVKAVDDKAQVIAARNGKLTPEFSDFWDARDELAEQYALRTRLYLDDVLSTPIAKEQALDILRQNRFMDFMNVFKNPDGTVNTHALKKVMEQQAKDMDSLIKVTDLDIVIGEFDYSSSIKTAAQLAQQVPKDEFLKPLTATGNFWKGAQSLGATTTGFLEKGERFFTRVIPFAGPVMKLGAGTLTIGETVITGAARHKTLTLILLGLYSQKQDSMNEKFNPQGENTIFLKQPSLLKGKSKAYDLPQMANYYLSLKRDTGQTSKRFHMVSPCKTDIKLTKATETCQAPKDISQYDIYKFLPDEYTIVKKGTIIYPEMPEDDPYLFSDPDHVDQYVYSTYLASKMLEKIEESYKNYFTTGETGHGSDALFYNYIIREEIVENIYDSIQNLYHGVDIKDICSGTYTLNSEVNVDLSIDLSALGGKIEGVKSFKCPEKNLQEIFTESNAFAIGIINDADTYGKLFDLFDIDETVMEITQQSSAIQICLMLGYPIQTCSTMNSEKVGSLWEDSIELAYSDNSKLSDAQIFQANKRRAYLLTLGNFPFFDARRTIGSGSFDQSKAQEFYGEDLQKSIDFYFNLHSFAESSNEPTDRLFYKHLFSQIIQEDCKQAAVTMIEDVNPLISGLYEYGPDNTGLPWKEAMFLTYSVITLGATADIFEDYFGESIGTVKNYIRQKSKDRAYYPTMCVWGQGIYPSYLSSIPFEYANTKRRTMLGRTGWTEEADKNYKTKIIPKINEILAKDDVNTLNLRDLLMKKNMYELKSRLLDLETVKLGLFETRRINIPEEDFEYWIEINDRLLDDQQTLGKIDFSKVVKLCPNDKDEDIEIRIGTGSNFWDQTRRFTITSLIVDTDMKPYRNYASNYCFTGKHTTSKAVRNALTYGSFVIDMAVAAGVGYLTGGNMAAVRAAVFVESVAVGALIEYTNKIEKWPKHGDRDPSDNQEYLSENWGYVL